MGAQPVATSEIIRRELSNHLGCEPERIVDDALLVDDLGADSLDVIEVAMALEVEFGVEIEDAVMRRLRTFGELVALVEREMAA
jgi:acyl carrier protein